MRSRWRLGAVLAGLLFGPVLFVVVLGHVTWYLAPRDAASIQKAAQFEAAVEGMLRDARSGALPQTAQDVPERYPVAPKAVHRVGEWPAERGRDCHEAPLLQARVASGDLPPVADRLPEDPLVIAPPEQTGPYGGGRGLPPGRRISTFCAGT